MFDRTTTNVETQDFLLSFQLVARGKEIIYNKVVIFISLKEIEAKQVRFLYIYIIVCNLFITFFLDCKFCFQLDPRA